MLVPLPPTNVVDIFSEIHHATARGVVMTPRSSSDKEYFAQDWFQDRLTALGLTYKLQGRNSHPDFWVTGAGVTEGYEVKSLALKGRGQPARKDFDCNSTIPSGVKGGRDVFIVFFVYTGSGVNVRGVHSVVVMHGDFINDERAIEHQNLAVHGFGSYGDGFIRDRKMYVFPHAFSIDPTGVGSRRLIVPAEWGVNDARLTKVKTLERDVATMRLRGYEVDLFARQITPGRERNPRSGSVREFDVFEHV